jgi:hypothetical protein
MDTKLSFKMASSILNTTIDIKKKSTIKVSEFSRKSKLKNSNVKKTVIQLRAESLNASLKSLIPTTEVIIMLALRSE